MGLDVNHSVDIRIVLVSFISFGETFSSGESLLILHPQLFDHLAVPENEKKYIYS